MKATIHLDGKEIFKSNKISQVNLDKKANELKLQNGCSKMEEQVKRGFKVFTSK